jgi:hypothetical protein
MRTAVLLTFLVLATALSAQFSSGFETWNDSLPTDWGGQKTNINVDSVEHVMEFAHGGLSAVRLVNPVENNERLTTQPQPVDSGVVYNYTFWARGHGQVHVAIFDERSAPGGISTYSTYVTIADDAVWQEVTASILCTHTSPIGEFIIGCRNTAGPEHLIVDDVNVDWSTSIQENTFGAVSLYPNPATDVLNVRLSQRSDASATYSLSDALGKTIRTGKLNSSTTLYVGELQRGLYFVRTQQGEVLRVSRFTKN